MFLRQSFDKGSLTLRNFLATSQVTKRKQIFVSKQHYDKANIRRRKIHLTQKKYFVRVQKNFSTRTKKHPFPTTKMAICHKESILPRKAALCHNEVNTKVSSCQNTRTEGKAKDSRTKPEVFPMYQYVNNLSTENCES